jgi:hypothetical protein
MRQLGLFLAVVIGFTSAATGGEELWMKYSEAATGRYLAKGEIPADGDVGELKARDKFIMESTLTPVAEGYALVGQQVLTVPEKPELKLHSTITSGWDPVDKAIQIAVYWSDASVERATLTGIKGNALTGTYSLRLSDGSVESADVEMVITDNDHHVWKFAGGPNAGQLLSHWQRVKTMVSAKDALQSYGDFMTGGVWTRQNDEGEELRHSYRWVLNGNFVQFTVLDDGPKAMVMTGLEPNTGRLMRWGFWEAGAMATSTLLQTGEGEWTIEILAAKNPETGNVYAGQRVIKKEGDNQLRVLNKMMVGEEPLVSENVWTRVPK